MFTGARGFLYRIALSLFVMIILIGFNGGCARTTRENVMLVIKESMSPAEVKLSDLQPGLSVLYFYDYYRHISNMPKGEKIIKKGKPGPPITQLNHRFAKYVNVFDSGESQGMGMVLDGYLHLENPGKYTFQAKTNDGFELYLNNTLLISDPGVHGDRLSDTGQITVDRGGWFPVHIKYFQRKGTAALALYWQVDGAAEFSIIPPEIYAH